MLQRGKKSAAGQETATPAAVVERPAPPAYLSEAQQAIWRRIVDAKPADWFSADGLDVLEVYCEQVDGNRALSADVRAMVADPKLTVQERLHMRERYAALAKSYIGTIASLATKLRLTQQSRYQPRAAATAHNANPKKPPPWQR